MTLISWNTGRQYQADGQIIYATMREGRTLFVDISRNISGAIESTPTEPIIEDSELEHFVMTNYDNNNYAPWDAALDQFELEVKRYRMTEPKN